MPRAAYVYKIYREFHKEHMNSLARDNPEALSWLKRRALQEAYVPRGACVSPLNGGSEEGIPCRVSHQKFQASFYSTAYVYGRDQDFDARPGSGVIIGNRVLEP